MGRQERRTGGRREKTPGRIRGPFEIVGEGRPSGKVEASMFLCFHGATLETHEMKSTGRTVGVGWCCWDSQVSTWWVETTAKISKPPCRGGTIKISDKLAVGALLWAGLGWAELGLVRGNALTEHGESKWTKN